MALVLWRDMFDHIFIVQTARPNVANTKNTHEPPLRCLTVCRQLHRADSHLNKLVSLKESLEILLEMWFFFKWNSISEVLLSISGRYLSIFLSIVIRTYKYLSDSGWKCIQQVNVCKRDAVSRSSIRSKCVACQYCIFAWMKCHKYKCWHIFRFVSSFSISINQSTIDRNGNDFRISNEWSNQVEIETERQKKSHAFKRIARWNRKCICEWEMHWLILFTACSLMWIIGKNRISDWSMSKCVSADVNYVWLIWMQQTLTLHWIRFRFDCSKSWHNFLACRTFVVQQNEIAPVAVALQSDLLLNLTPLGIRYARDNCKCCVSDINACRLFGWS